MKIHKLIFISLLILLPSLLIFPLYAQQDLSVTWDWIDGKNLHQGTKISFSVVITKTNPDLSINVTSIWIHTSWMESNVFTIDNFDYELKTGENRFNFTRAISSTAVLGETNDFACIIKYKISNGTEFDSSLIRSSSVTIRKGQTIYSDQTINLSNIGNIVFFFFVSLGCMYLFRKDLKTFLENKTKYIPIILFISVFFVYVLSVSWNFIDYLVSESTQQGFLITGDEPHYVLVIKAILKGTFDINQVYPVNKVQHSIISEGLLMNGTRVSTLCIGLPLLSIIPYVLGESFINSGVFGVLIMNCLFASGIIVLIYKFGMLFTKDIVVSIVTALTFAFSTLLFPWAGQIFPEIILGFMILLVTYKVFTASSGRDWIIAAVLIGFYTLFRRQMIYVAFLSVGLIFIFLYKNKEHKKLRYFILSFVGAFSVSLLYDIIVVGFGTITLVGTGGQVSIPPTYNILGVHVNQYFWLGLIGHWIDSNSGLLFYSPILILSFLGLYSFIKKNRKFPVIFVLSIFSFWYVATGIIGGWHGWLSIPSRFMICMLPLLSLPFLYSLKEFKNSKLFKGSYVVLFLMGLISSGFIAFNRVLGYILVWVNGVGRTRYILTMADTFKVDISPLPDYAYAWFNGGDIGNVPQSSVLLAGWAVGFLVIVALLLCIGYKGNNLNITEKIEQSE